MSLPDLLEILVIGFFPIFFLFVNDVCHYTVTCSFFYIASLQALVSSTWNLSSGSEKNSQVGTLWLRVHLGNTNQQNDNGNESSPLHREAFDINPWMKGQQDRIPGHLTMTLKRKKK